METKTEPSATSVENLYKNNKNGRYYARLYFSQGGKSKSTFKSLRTDKVSVAKQRLPDELVTHEAGKSHLAETGTDHTVAELFAMYRDHIQQTPGQSAHGWFRSNGWKGHGRKF